jgi:hypothetical protein
MKPIEKLRALLESKGIYKEAISLMREHTRTTRLLESIWEIDAGYMRNTDDIHGLERYLKSMSIIPANGEILPMSEFEHLEEDPARKQSLYGNSPIYGYYINLNERGYFSADVRDINGKTVYEVKNEDEELEDEVEFGGDEGDF